jgi:hypothetical protein
MTNEHPIAFADEAFLQRPGHPGAYLFSAVLVDQDELETVIDAARAAAGQHGEYHTTQLYRRGHIQPIEDMLDATAAHAGWTLLTVKAPLGGDTQSAREAARQATLTQLLRQLDTQRVRNLVLDTRASASEQLQTRLEGRNTARSDLPDVTTYRKLVRDQLISPRLRIMHVDDRRQPALWMADATAWAFQRALNFDEPQWWSRVTSAATITNADTGKEITLESNRAAPPIGDRGPQNLSQSAQASLLTTKFYTLTGGTTNRSQGPGVIYQSLLRQITERQNPPRAQQLIDQIADLGQRIATLGHAISSTAQQNSPHGQPVAPENASRDPEPDSATRADTDNVGMADDLSPENLLG